MRQPFTYQLDEERLRRELRAQRAPASGEAYQRFCAYSDTHSRPVTRRSMPSINLKMDRKYLVPAAAALVVLLLSILLVNFAGAGSDKEATAVTTSEPFVPMPQTEPEIVIPPLESHDLPEPVATENGQALVTKKPEVVREVVAGDEDKSDELKSIPQTVAASAPENQPATGSVQPATTQVNTKKQRRDAADLLEPVQMPDIRPTLLTPEQEEDIRIN